MNPLPAPDCVSAASGRPIRYLFGAAFVVALGLAALLWSRSGTPPASSGAEAPEEVLRSALRLREGRLYRPDADEPFTGVVVERYPDGGLQARATVSDGVLHGVSEGWYKEGRRQVIEHFKEGVSHGRRTKWHPNGTKQAEAGIVEGRIEGVFRRWHEDGGLAEEITMKNGVPDGMARAYHPDGRLKAEVLLAAGEVVNQRARPEPAQTGH
jgi:antitoxin component YwqK of YwqJK toxin-antitoxin module